MKKATLDLRNCDNMKLMAEYPDNYFDLLFDDPPYGIGEDGRKTKGREGFVKQKNGNKIFFPAKDYKIKSWDNKPPSIEYFKESNRVSKNQIVFGANYFPFYMGESKKPPRRNEFDSFLQENPVGFIIWDKVNGDSDQHDCEIIYTSFNFKSFVLPYMWAGFCQGKSISEGTLQKGDKRKNENRIHPTQKPLALVRHLLDRFAFSECVLLDNHLGSGTSAIACHELGFDLVGCELDTDYYNDMMKRVTNEVNKKSLFFDSEIKQTSEQIKMAI